MTPFSFVGKQNEGWDTWVQSDSNQGWGRVSVLVKSGHSCWAPLEFSPCMGFGSMSVDLCLRFGRRLQKIRLCLSEIISPALRSPTYIASKYGHFPEGETVCLN